MRFYTTYFFTIIVYFASSQAYSNPHDPLLKAAVLARNAQEVNLQLTLGATPHQVVDDAGNTLLHHAAQHNLVEIATSLLLGPPADYVIPLPMLNYEARGSCRGEADVSTSFMGVGDSFSGGGIGALLAMSSSLGALSGGDLDALPHFGHAEGKGIMDGVACSRKGPLAEPIPFSAELFVGASPLALNAQGFLPLHVAIANGNVAMVNLLGQNGGGEGVQTLIFSPEILGENPLPAGFLAALTAALPHVANSLTILSLTNLQTAIPLENDDSDSDGDGHIIFSLMNAPEFGNLTAVLAAHDFPAFTTLELNHLGTITDEHSNVLESMATFLQHVSPTLQSLSLASIGLHSAYLNHLLTMLLAPSEQGGVHFPALEILNLAHNFWNDDALLEQVTTQLAAFIVHHEHLHTINFSDNQLPQAFIDRLILRILGSPAEGIPENPDALTFEFLSGKQSESKVKRFCEILFR